MHPPHDALLQALPQLAGKKVLILGDVMLDVYLEGDTERISPEAPVPVVNICNERYMLGGAANVANNILALGGAPSIISLSGAGRDGDTLQQLLQEQGITSHVVRSAHRRTIVKSRVMARGQQMLRLDKEDCLPPTEEETAALCQQLENLLPQHEVLVISDYAKGLLTPKLRQYMQHIAESMPRMPEILVDPKPSNAPCYANVSLMTPNKKEAAQLAGMELLSREDIIEAGQRIMQRFSCAELLITLGGEGMALFLRHGSVWNIPTATRAVFDVTGAGDTVIATVALARAAGLSTQQACLLANFAAGLVVEHVGVATVTTTELQTAIEHSHTIHFIPWSTHDA